MSLELDLSHERCPVPFIQMKLALKDLLPGNTLVIFVRDKASSKDIIRFLSKKNIEFSQVESANHSVKITITGR